MNKISQIISTRGYQHQSFFDLIYEWEDTLSKIMGIPIIRESKLFDLTISKMIPFAYYLQINGQVSLCFQLGSEIITTRSRFLQDIFGLRTKNIKQVIPCIIDFWQRENEFKIIEKIYNKNKIILITSREVYEYLKSRGCKNNYKHWALSLPDKYRITPETKYEKKYDIAIMGRQDSLLESFLSLYTERHPNLLYAYKKKENGHFNYYTNKGSFIGCADDRVGYFNIMRGAKSALYSTPGLDNNTRANGYNQVTPRFLELLSAGCHVLARYTDNPDTAYFELNKFSPNIQSYEQFESLLDRARVEPVDMKKHSDYLAKHYTSVRAKELENLLKAI
jgi:hypothetical protein